MRSKINSNVQFIKVENIKLRKFFQGVSFSYFTPKLLADKYQVEISNYNYNSFLFLAMPCTCGILVSWLGNELVSSALEARSLNHWTTREIPSILTGKTFMHFWVSILTPTYIKHHQIQLTYCAYLLTLISVKRT